MFKMKPLRNLKGTEKDVKKANKIRNKLLNYEVQIKNSDDPIYSDYFEHVSILKIEIMGIMKAKTFLKNRKLFSKVLFRTKFSDNETNYFYNPEFFKPLLQNLMSKKEIKKLHVFPPL